MTKKITWYNPKIRMPKVGDEIITFTKPTDFLYIIEVTKVFKRKFEGNALQGASDWRRSDFKYWTYAKNLGFPKGR